jgi:hypothetical protein
MTNNTDVEGSGQSLFQGITLAQGSPNFSKRGPH